MSRWRAGGIKVETSGHREISAHGEHDVVPTGNVEQRITLPDELLHPLPHVVIVQLFVVLLVPSRVGLLRLLLGSVSNFTGSCEPAGRQKGVISCRTALKGSLNG